jgi:SAM-dependent methyltransferase
MAFDVAAQSYDRFMGRYSRLLAPRFVDFAGIRDARRVLDVGCGPGALLAELAARRGTEAVAAVDPSASFVEAARARNPGAAVAHASAEQLPFDDASFDAALAQLVVHFMRDPVRGLSEMRRVTRPGGVVAACVWDHAGGRSPAGIFWEAALELDSAAHDESSLAGVREGHLVELLGAAGLRQVEGATLGVELPLAGFEEWWEPFREGVGPAGAYLATLAEEQQGALRERCRRRVPDGSFALETVVWAARGIA